MTQSNFVFLSRKFDFLAGLAQQAESYAHSDPESCAIKLRCLAEQIAAEIYKAVGVRAERSDNFVDLLKSEVFLQVVDDDVVDKFHHLRVKGNRAAHGKGLSIDDALALLKDGFYISAWYYASYAGGSIDDIPQYVSPAPPEDIISPLLEDNAKLKQNLLLQSEELEKAIAELNASQRDVQFTLSQIPIGDPISFGERLDQLALAGSVNASRLNMNPLATLRRIALQDVFAEYDLTPGQTLLVDQLAEFLSDRTKKVFLVKGYAGTGKTFITKGLTEYFRFIKRSYILAAPTGKAAKVIANKTQSAAHTIHKTIYSFKDLREYRDEGLEGTEAYKVYAKLAVNENSSDTVYVVDEASMISDVYQEGEFFRCGSGYMLRDLLKYINLDHNDHFKKLILIGDDAQLPPVGMGFSPALDSKYLVREHNLQSEEYELTEVVRQKAGSGVMENSIKLRKSLTKGVFNELEFEMGYDDLTHIEPIDLMPAYLSASHGKISAEVVVIAYSNADVLEFNKRIRQHFFPGVEEVTKGDKLMVTSNNSAHGFLISNGDFAQVRDIHPERESRVVKLKRQKSSGEIEVIPVPIHFRDATIIVRNLEGEPVQLAVKILENLLYSENAGLSSDENKALYVDFAMRLPHLKPNTLEFKETLVADPYFNALKVKFGYAITCHKAQGSEWNHVFIKCRTHMSQLSKDYFRWLYTAITRTSKQLYLLDEPHIKIGSGIKVNRNPGRQSNAVSQQVQRDFSATETQSNKFDKLVSVTHSNYSVLVPPPGSAPPIINTSLSGANNDFGITSDVPLRFAILNEVKSAINGRGINLVDVQPMQYKEVYIFQKGSDSARLDISYTNASRVSSIVAPHTTELSNNIRFLLETVVGKLLVMGSESEFEIPQDFLQVFYDRLKQACDAREIHIAGVKALNNMQRYTFEKAGGSAVVDIYYNKKKQMSKCVEQPHLCKSIPLLDEVLSVITGEL
jgi:hypothetical protein